MKLLFVTWDGPGNNYLESLFVPILRGLGAELHVLQFSYAGAAQVEATREAMAALGVGYEDRPVYRFSPLSASTGLSVARGALSIVRQVRKIGATHIIVRSNPPALMALAARQLLRKQRLIFEADGIPQDERAELEGWSPLGVNYRLYREAEAQLTRVADAVLTRTSGCKQLLLDRAGPGVAEEKIFVAPNGKDAEAFSPAAADPALRARLNIPADAPLLIYCGSLGPKYHPERLVQLFSKIRARRPDAYFLILSGYLERAQALAAGEAQIVAARAAPEEVPAYLAIADAGVALIGASFSQSCMSPIKLGEYLLCGLPVIATAEVGDVAERLEGCPAAHLLKDLSEAELERAAQAFADGLGRPELKQLARQRGLEVFSLQAVQPHYRAALSYTA